MLHDIAQNGDEGDERQREWQQQERGGIWKSNDGRNQVREKSKRGWTNA